MLTEITRVWRRLFDWPHGLRIDAEDNIWATDGGSHIVLKFSPQGRVLMVLGVRGSPGEWHAYGHLRRSPSSTTSRSGRPAIFFERKDTAKEIRAC
jgi:hypothetical protein